MERNNIDSRLKAIRKNAAIDSPVLRHFVKQHPLSDVDVSVLAELLTLTNNMTTEIKTTYTAISASVGQPTRSVYESLDALHRCRIIEYKPEHEYVRIGFRELSEPIEEISLAHRNAEKIRHILDDLKAIKGRDVVLKNDLFDLIYPLVGKIVQKKVAEAFRSLVNYINDRLDSTLSVKIWSYRIKSWKSGIPLAEIILRASLPFVVEELLLIDRKTGILLASASGSRTAPVDRDLVSGMLSAINDFIVTSFSRAGGDSCVNSIQYGSFTIFVEEGRYCYAAIVVDGSPDMQFHEDASALLDTVHARFRTQLRSFSGDVSEVSAAGEFLEEFIRRKNTPPPAPAEKSYFKVKALAASLAVLLTAITGWWIFSEIGDYRLERRVMARIASLMPRNTIDIDIDADGGEITVSGYVNSFENAERLTGEIRSIKEVKSVRNRALVVNFSKVREYEQSIEEIRRQMVMVQLEQVRTELEKNIIQFPVNVSVLANPQRFQLQRAYEILKQYPDIHIDIVAFADKTGGVEINRDLAQKRMESIRSYLVSIGMSDERMKVHDFDPEVIRSNPRFSNYRDKRGIMLFARLSDR